MKEIEIVLEIWKLEKEWNVLNNPQMNWYGNMTFNNPARMSLQELEHIVNIQNRTATLKRELRKKLGLWRYVRYSLSPISFIKNLSF